MRILAGGDPNGELTRKRGLDVLEVSDGAISDDIRRKVRDAFPQYADAVYRTEIKEFQPKGGYLEHPAVAQRRAAAELTERNRREQAEQK